MTDANARTVANAVIVSVGVAAAVAIVASPPLRRLAFLAARVWIGATVPAYLLAETRRAWVESGRPA